MKVVTWATGVSIAFNPDAGAYAPAPDAGAYAPAHIDVTLDAGAMAYAIALLHRFCVMAWLCCV